jgi:UDP-N-acetylmuramyl pentapeptide phosphotransferase/UDP-N-acetylglucosamine-1-phosphate transferase
MNLLSITLVVLAGTITYLGIDLFRRLSLKKQWLDVPNQRSSHKEPTPRGAGLVVVPTCLVGYYVATIMTGTNVSWAYIVGAVMIAGISWLDDLYSIAFFWRLSIHVLAALLLIGTEGYWSEVNVGPGISFSLGWLGIFVTTLWVVWVINAYNFMDGIDGIAGVQGLVASAAWALIAFRSSNGIYVFLLIVFASQLAFIFHNWSPAKVFIGDVGSAYLGFTYAVMPLLIGKGSTANTGLLPVAAVLILWPFVFDTVLTMVRRASRGEMIWRAHREHLYQRLVIAGFSHSVVSAIYGLFAVITSAAAVLIVNGQLGNLLFAVYGSLALLSVLLVVAVGSARSHRQPYEVSNDA